jgi:hypothetical protein
MRKILYVMHFIGRRSQASADSQSLRTTSSATSCLVSTMIQPGGLQTDLKASDGGMAFLESELHLTGSDSFREDGMIVFGEESEHVLRFSTVGQGHMEASPEDGTMAGTAVWKVEGGEGQFAAACGFISSTFTLTETGELSDFQSGLIMLPD